MQHQVVKNGSFRELSLSETALVGGGFITDPDLENAEQEIIVTGTRMTAEQRDAYNSWVALVTFDVYATIALGAGLIAAGGYVVGGAVGVVVGVGGEVGLGLAVEQGQEAIDQFILDQAELLYRWDAQDGVYNGPYGYVNPY